MVDDNDEAVMTVSEVSEFLRLGESTVYRLAKEGKIPARKVGGMWRFSREGLNEWLAHIPIEAQ